MIWESWASSFKLYIRVYDSFVAKTLATSNNPISASSKPSFQYANQLFNNSIIFENVLNLDDEKNLKAFFLNLINERLNGVLPSLEESMIHNVSPILSKDHSFLVSFNIFFDAISCTSSPNGKSTTCTVKDDYCVSLDAKWTDFTM